MTTNFADDVAQFAEAAMGADYTKLRRIGQRLAAAMADEHAEAARRVRLAIGRKGVPLQAAGFTEALPVDGKSRLPLVEELPCPAAPCMLPEDARDIFQSFIDDATHHDLLEKNGIASKLSLMLSGPPGTGKTLLAGHIAARMGKKLYVARLDSLISSMLGDTAKNVRAIFDFVAGKDAVLFLDELDAIAKVRDDRNELGELKRVVNTVIQGIDSLEDRTVLLAATNHPQMLDPAIWRRFSYHIHLGMPESDLRQALWIYFLGDSSELSEDAKILAALSEGATGADIQRLALAARRRATIRKESVDFLDLAIQVTRQGSSNRPTTTKEVDLRRSIARILVQDFGAAQSEVARFLKVSRQSVSAYLKG
ncbi:AAA family ATPase [Stenotrophomonas pavanii]|uniref:AAA family ATPase n=1 Tax=Stenotrophomonas TaxID=40323 RepID=UPI0013107979|nr:MULTISPECIES: AAA family ATPase [unclassified Stenotrophomonas]MBN5175845.1 AAA family ATPase [Stenotrophomonas maltophilia]MCU1121739.1 AAA family ATPase [Stenotrophomonas maltophilia]MDQ7278445.1 AAA family ATPase [Stenotrophomonas sp. Sm3147]MDQ7287273.1 AAA family ATPase [Stenotrophomonas sp. Sm5341]